MKFRVVLPVLCSAMAFAASASALQTDNSGQVTVTGNVSNFADAKENNLLYSVLKAEDYQAGGDMLTKSILFNGTTYDAATGAYSIPLTIKAPTGDYKIVIFTQADSFATFDLQHTSYYFTEFNVDIKGNDALSEAEKVEKTVELLNTYSVGMEIDHLAYNHLPVSVKESLAKELLNSESAFTSNDGFDAIVEAHNITNELFKNGTAANVDAYLADCLEAEGNRLNTPLMEEFSTFSEESRLATLDKFVGAELADDFEEKLAFQMFSMKTANLGYYDQLKPFITDEDNIYGFGESDLSAYNSSNNKTGILKAFKNRIDALKATSTIADVRTAFHNAVLNPVKVETGSSNGGSSGGSSSGSSGGSTSVTLPTAPGPVKPNTDTPASKTDDFADLPQSHWAYKAVEALREDGIVSGYDDETFAPNESVTREQFIKMLTAGLRLTGVESEVNFTDVPEDAWYRNAVGAAIRAGITNGVTDTEFGVGTNITREQAAVMINRAASAKKLELPVAGEVSFFDSDAVSDYAKASVSALANAGIITGDEGAFRPQGTLTRAEAAKILYEFFNATGLI